MHLALKSDVWLQRTYIFSWQSSDQILWSILYVTQLLCNTFIKIKENPPYLGLLSSPYFAHDASCVMLNIDWTPCLLFSYTPLPFSVELWPQFFFTAVYRGQPLTTVQNFTDMVPWNPPSGLVALSAREVANRAILYKIRPRLQLMTNSKWHVRNSLV